MTIAYLHLIRLHPSHLSTQAFITLIRQHALSYHYSPLITSVARQWVARPTVTDSSALNKPWDLLLLLRPSSDASPAPVPSSLTFAVADSYSLKVAVPSRLLADWEETNKRVRAVRMDGFDGDRLERLSRERIRSSSQKLEVSEELVDFARVLVREEGERRPVTMLNFLRFNEGEPGRESYRRYGKAFAEDVGSKRGGNAKIVGKVVGGGQGEKAEWDEVAIVHYPNIVAFCDMASADDYQAANAKWRLPALKDTLLLCTTEVIPETGSTTSKL